MQRAFLAVMTLALVIQAHAQQESGRGVLRQQYSSKVGFYQPGEGLNNGLVLGVDGITEFLKYDFFLSGAADLYMKQTIGIFQAPEPTVHQQQILLIPLHVNVAYKFFDNPNADSRGYAGIGGGYYLYFYNVEYSSGSGGGSLLSGPIVSANSADSKNGGNGFATAFVRLLIGQIFIEPRYFLAARRTATVKGPYTFVVDPTGFAVTIGFQSK